MRFTRRARRGFSLDAAMGLGLGAPSRGGLGLAPDVFWSMSPREFLAAASGPLVPGQQAQGSSLMTRATLEALQARYPDDKADRSKGVTDGGTFG